MSGIDDKGTTYKSTNKVMPQSIRCGRSNFTTNKLTKKLLIKLVLSRNGTTMPINTGLYTYWNIENIADL